MNTPHNQKKNMADKDFKETKDVTSYGLSFVNCNASISMYTWQHLDGRLFNLTCVAKMYISL